MARILHISTRLILGGSQENTVLSCEGQARLGHEVHLAFGPIYGPEGSSLPRVQDFNARCAAAAESAPPIGIHEVPTMYRAIGPGDARCARDLRDLIERLRPDIVHTHSSKAGILGRWAGWNARWTHAGRIHRPAVIHTIHGPPFAPPAGPLPARLKCRVANTLFIASERWAARRCHLIVGVADAMRDQYLARGIGQPEQYRTVYSGMEVERYLSPEDPAADAQIRAQVRRQYHLRDDDFVIGTVARLAEQKGHDDILDALAADLRTHPNWKLLWIGDGWWRERLLARVASLNLTSQVVAPGLVPSAAVGRTLRALDILVHASYREGLPRTVPQALLAGRAVVAYDVDGTREACIPHTTGLLVPLGDRPALRAAVISLYDQPAFRARLAAAGRELCRTRFAARNMVDHLEHVYAQARALLA